MAGIPYNEVLPGFVENRHHGTVQVNQWVAHRTPMREETWIGDRLHSVDRYDELRMVDSTASFETMKVDIVFPDGTYVRTEGRDLREGDLVMFARHRGTNGDVDDVFDVKRHQWHFVGIDRAPPVSRVTITIGAMAGGLGIYLGGGDLSDMVKWGAIGVGAAVTIDRLLIVTRKVELHFRRKQTEREMGRLLARR